MRPTRPTVQLTSPQALRAYAHPTRLALVGLLRHLGPLTATAAADLTGESVASCSFHQRQLAKYGLVEPAAAADGRERPWQVTAMSTSWGPGSDDPDLAAATEALDESVFQVYVNRVRDWFRHRREMPPAWQDAAEMGDWVLHLTAAELRQLNEQTAALLLPYQNRIGPAAVRPRGSREVVVIRLAFPVIRDKTAAGSAGLRRQPDRRPRRTPDRTATSDREMF
jgi:hypothetical protein